MNAWKRFWTAVGDNLLLAAGILIAIIWAGIRLLGIGRGADSIRGDFDSAKRDAKDAGERVESGKARVERSEERVDRSIGLNQQSQSLNQEARDIIDQIRKRGKTEDIP